MLFCLNLLLFQKLLSEHFQLLPVQTEFLPAEPLLLPEFLLYQVCFLLSSQYQPQVLLPDFLLLPIQMRPDSLWFQLLLFQVLPANPLLHQVFLPNQESQPGMPYFLHYLKYCLQLKSALFPHYLKYCLQLKSALFPKAYLLQHYPPAICQEY